MPVDVDEGRRPDEPPDDYVVRLAADKASAVESPVDGQSVLAADTVVLIDGSVLGKPRDPAEAAAMLQRLSGRTHEVLTGVAVRCGRRASAGWR